MKDRYEDALEVFNSLNTKERYFVAENYFDDNPNVMYRKVLKENDTPIAFLELYVLPETPTYAYVVVATNKKYRGKGNSKKLVKMAETYNRRYKKYDKFIWLANKKNYPSINEAMSLGYEVVDDEEVILEKEFFL